MTKANRINPRVKDGLVAIGSPEHLARIEQSDYIERLEVAARKAAMMSLAVTGEMELRQDNHLWGLRDALDQLQDELEDLASWWSK